MAYSLAMPSPAKPHRAWVRLPSGKRMDLNDPTFADLDDGDLALGLARTFRWGGHSVWPLPLSVAQHSLLVLHIRRQQASLSPVQGLRELLHDAEEGVIGFDPISPLKPVLGAEFLALMDRLQKVVFAKYALPWWTAAEKARHKKADILAAASEAVHIAGWSRAEVKDVLGITVAPLAQDPLCAHYGGKPWEPWPVDVCVRRFLGELGALLAQREAADSTSVLAKAKPH